MHIEAQLKLTPQTKESIVSIE